VPIIAVKNEFLGGNIGCAGLLTVRDIIKTIKKKKNIKYILLPSIIFDEKGLDITGKSYLKINKGKVILI